MNPTSDSPKRCERCGSETADATQNLCPRCLMAQAMQPTQAGNDTATLPTLTPEELAPHFPQLEILECLGRGGMGVVYKARQKSLDRLVALKLLAPERSDDPQFAARFEKEARALAALNHPHIVGVHDFGQADGFYYLLMEYVDGVNLRQLLRARRLTPKEALSIVPPVCEALQCAHDRGIVHRDIKPENLLIDKAGTVKIADFGIAKIVANDAARQPAAGTQTSVNVPSTNYGATLGLGTPDYAAPEQHESGATLDHRADIYSLGVVLYEMLTGERPKDKFEPPSKRVQVDIRIDDIVLRALEKTPELRFATAAEFRTRVEAVVTEKMPRRAPVIPQQERFWRMAGCLALAVVALWSWSAALNWTTRMPIRMTPDMNVTGATLMSPAAPIAIGIFAVVGCLALAGLVMLKPLRLFMKDPPSGVSSANPPVVAAIFVLLVLVSLAVCVFGLLLQQGLRGEGAALLLIALAAATPLAVARAKISGPMTPLQLANWLRALSISAFILAVPCLFFGGMFMVTILRREHGSLNPGEAFVGTLLSVIGVLLPIAGVRLRAATPQRETSAAKSFVAAAVTVGAIALVLFLIAFVLSANKERAARELAHNRRMQASIEAAVAAQSSATNLIQDNPLLRGTGAAPGMPGGVPNAPASQTPQSILPAPAAVPGAPLTTLTTTESAEMQALREELAQSLTMYLPGHPKVRALLGRIEEQRLVDAALAAGEPALVAALAARLSRELTTKGPEHPVVKDLMRQLEAARKKAAKPPTAAQGGMMNATLTFRWVRDEPSRDTEELALDEGDPNAPPQKLLVDRNIVMDQRDVDLVGASATESGAGRISIVLTEPGAAKFATLTREGKGKRLAIVMDGKLYAAPVIQEEITHGRLEITGKFTPEEAQRMAADVIRSRPPSQ